MNKVLSHTIPSIHTYKRVNKLSALSICIPAPRPTHTHSTKGMDEKSINHLASLMTTLTFKLWYKTNPYTQSQSNKLSQFIKTLLKNPRITAHSAMVSMLYLSRLVSAIPEGTTWIPQVGSELRMVVTALMLADTQVHDASITLSAWSKVTWLDVQVLSKMKTEFLNAIQWKLNVGMAEYKEWIVKAGEIVNAKECK